MRFRTIIDILDVWWFLVSNPEGKLITVDFPFPKFDNFTVYHARSFVSGNLKLGVFLGVIGIKECIVFIDKVTMDMQNNYKYF